MSENPDMGHPRIFVERTLMQMSGCQRCTEGKKYTQLADIFSNSL